jgi:RND family efflux transporter MFP subunit
MNMKIKLFPIVLLVLIFSCSADKQAELNKLRKQQNDLAQKIKSMESDSTVKDQPDIRKERLVSIKEIVPVTFNHYIEVQGKLDGDENVGISPQAPGKLVSILVSVGQNVNKGQLLAKLDDDVMQQQLKQMQTNLNFLTEVYEKQKRLWDQHVGSEVQYLGAKNSKESMEQQIATLKNQIETMHITSPINGTIEDISVKEGQIVSPGLPIIRVVNFDKIKVVADLSEAYSNKIKVGDKVKIYFPDLGHEVDAIVSFSSRYINPVNRSFSVEAKVIPAISGLKVNMVAVMRINDYVADNAIAIPVNLIQNERDQQIVYIVEANSEPKAKKVPVTTGINYEGMVEITGGLHPGDKLITLGYQDLEDGEAIRF